MAATWYVERGGRRTGPYTPAQLKELVASGRLQPTDMVMNETMAKAIPAAKVKGLFPAQAGPPLSQVAQEDPATPDETPGPGPASMTEKPASSLREKLSALPGWQKGVAILGVVMTGFCLFSCVVGVITNLAGYKPKEGRVASKQEEKAGVSKTNQKTQPTVPAKNENVSAITEDFFPHKPGTVLVYDADWYMNDGVLIEKVVRTRCTYKEDGVIECVDIKEGRKKRNQITGEVQWGGDINRPNEGFLGRRYRKTPDAIELGSDWPGGGMLWRPILKLDAKEKDKWEWKRDDKPKMLYTYEVVGFGERDDRTTVVTHWIQVEDSNPFQFSHHDTFAKGVGLVYRNTQIGFKGTAKRYRYIELVKELSTVEK